MSKDVRPPESNEDPSPYEREQLGWFVEPTRTVLWAFRKGYQVGIQRSLDDVLDRL